MSCGEQTGIRQGKGTTQMDAGGRLFVVGKPYPIQVPRGITGAVYEWDGAAHRVCLIEPRIPAHVVQAVQGPLTFGVFVAYRVVWLLLKFGGASSTAAPFTPHLLMPETPLPPLALPGEPGHAMARVELIDSTTNILLAVHACTLSPSVTRALHGAITEEFLKPWDGEAAYDRRIAQSQAAYPVSKMWEYALAKCQCGD